MKKIKNIAIFILVALLAFTTLALGGCTSGEKPTYTLDTQNFESVAVYGGTLDTSGLVIKKKVGKTTTDVAVTSDMITGVDTSSAGEKTLTVSYAGQTLTANYVVKYEVKYLVEGEPVSTQYVLSASEITPPAEPVKEGYIFDGWLPALPATLTENITLDAQFHAKPVLSSSEITTWENSGSLDFTALAKDNAVYSYEVRDGNGAVSSTLLDVVIDQTNKEIEFSFKNESFVGKAQILFTVSVNGVAVSETTCVINKKEKPLVVIGNVGEENQAYSLGFGANGFLPVSVNDNDVSLTVSANNDNVSVQYASGLIIVQANKAGVSTVTVTATGGKNPNEIVKATKSVVVKPRNFLITQSAKKYGIEGVRTIGRTDVSGNASEFALTLSAGEENDIGAGFYENVTWVSSSDKATVSSDGVITLSAGTGEEMVDFKGKFSAGGVEHYTPVYSLRCVYDGVNVSNYADLYSATKAQNPQPIVLQADIKEDFSATNYDLIHTTYDDTYYKNLGVSDSATVKVLLQFRNDLYGNGYVINAHNATYKLDASGKPTSDALFTGPLNFVAMSETGGVISVKAQDNICFALHDGVTVKNVELRGCDLTADGNGNYDLTDLDYIGTTVEVFGDVNIEHSRITNGRTVLRAFGDGDSDGDGEDIADPTKVINVNISNSVLSGAREFIMRIGSNCFKDGYKIGDVLTNSPYLDGDDETSKKYNTKKTYGSMTALEKEAYDQSFIKTFVNVKNSVFKDAGIFAIGIDSHFSGPALHEGHSILGSSSQYWRELAKTSYGAKLTFEGDVRTYNWKRLSDIDSSTLIENLFTEGMLADLTFNVQEMVETVASKEQFKNIIKKYKGAGDSEEVSYVHAGIAFFGGGKNYGVFEKKAYGEHSSHDLLTYEVSFADVGKDFLTTAAGDEPFYFMLCDATSTFSPSAQDEILASEDAYSPIYTK